MRSAVALQIAPENVSALAAAIGRERRSPTLIEDPEPAPGREATSLQWPVSWPAELYVGESRADCTAHEFSMLGAVVAVADPPPEGTPVALKFPFTIYLRGRVAWRRGRDLGIEFDPDMRRSARIVEDVLLDRSAA